MNQSYTYLQDGNFHPTSRVWVYQAIRPFSETELPWIGQTLQNFIAGWQSHDEPVRGFAQILFSQFIILMADETVTKMGGCSTDESIRMIKHIEKESGNSLFDRQQLAFLINDRVTVLPLAGLQAEAEMGRILPGTLYFNNLVLTKEELERNWIIPVEKSWLAKKILFPGKVS